MTAATTTKYSPPPQSPECGMSRGFLQRLADGNFPLQGELNALSDLVDSIRVDLLQTSMLIDYATDFLKKKLNDYFFTCIVCIFRERD